MDLNRWVEKFEEVQAAIDNLRKRAGVVRPQYDIIQEALEALQATMEQLSVTGEELHQQQSELNVAYAQAEAERTRYRDLFAFAPDGYLVTNAQGKITEANQAAMWLLNINQELLQGRLLLTFVLPEDQQRFVALLQNLRAGESIHERNLRLQQRGNGFFYVAIVAQPARHEPTGKVTSIRWMLRDVTERVQQEQALRTSEAALAQANQQLEQRVAERTADLRVSEERFRLVLHGSPVTVFHQDTDLRYTWMYNPVEPYDPSDIIGKTEYELLEPDNAERLTSIKRRVLETGQSYREHVPWVKQHETRWYDMKLEPLRDPQGSIIGLTGVSTDVTEYHRTAEAQRFLAEVSDLLITSTDPDSLLHNVAQHLVGRIADGCVFALPSEQGLELRVIHHHNPARNEALRKWLEQGLREQPEQHPLAAAMHGSETVYIYDDEAATAAVGSNLPASEDRVDLMPLPITSLVSVSLMARGEVIGVMGLLNDQPGQKSTEHLPLIEELVRRVALALDTTLSYDRALHARAEAENALQMRDQVFRIITHDLKTPLTTIHGYAYLLRRQLEKLGIADTEKLLRDSNQITTAVEQMTRHIDELLIVAHLQSDKALDLAHKPIDLPALVQRIAEIHQQVATTHTICVQSPSSELVVLGDQAQLERVFTNLLSNALKYSPHGGTVELILSAEQRSDTSGTLISICDEGMGIPAVDLPYLFEPFRRGSNVKEHTSGTGLGLVSVRYVVEQHGGTITVNSQEGQGSVFSVWLPLHQEP